MGLLHNLGQVGGHALNALPGYSTLGANITNPNVNYLGAQNPPTPSNNYYGASQPTKADTGAAGQDGTTLAASTNVPSGPSYDPNVLRTYDQGISSLKDNLATILAGLTGAQSTAENSFQTAVNDNTTSHNRNQANYDTQTTDTTNAEQKALGQVDTNTRTLSDSLRRIIGMAGGANSSAYQLAAPMAAARQGTQQRGNTLDSYGMNLRDIGTARDQETTDFQKLLDSLAVQKQQKLQEAQISTDRSLIGANGQLADAAAKRAALIGGDPNAAQQPYVSEASNRQVSLDQMLANPVLAPVIAPLTPATPNLRDYTVDRGNINANTQAGTNNPYAYFLNKKQDQVAPAL